VERQGEERLPEYITTGFVAKRCGVSNTTVLRWIRKQHLPAFRLPAGHYRIHRDDFGRFLDFIEVRLMIKPRKRFTRYSTALVRREQRLTMCETRTYRLTYSAEKAQNIGPVSTGFFILGSP